MADEVEARHRVTAIINSYPTSVSVIIVLLKTKHWIKISRILYLPTRIFGRFEGNLLVIKLSVSIFGQTTGYKFIP